MSVNRGAYAQYEDEIYDCVARGATATLSWTFVYSDSSRTMPIYLYYAASYSSLCPNTNPYFSN